MDTGDIKRPLGLMCGDMDMDIAIWICAYMLLSFLSIIIEGTEGRGSGERRG